MTVLTSFDFAGRSEQVLEYYREALGAEIVFMMRFSDSPDQTFTQPGMEHLIFHATFRIAGTEFMCSDVGHADPDKALHFAGFALVLRLESAEVAKRTFDALAAEGKVIVPLAESAFTGWYGIVMDPFGVSWKINVPK